MKELLTIIIPSKNESDIIGTTLSNLNHQNNIKGVKVIICDSSTDDTIKVINSGNYPNLDISFTKGGLPAVARNNGAYFVKTPYVLFMDADMFLYDKTTITESLNTIIKSKKHLVTCKFRCKGKYSFIFPIFESLRALGSWYSTCAIGGFMLFDKKVFDEVGGFNDEDKFAEDYNLSLKISPKKFIVLNKKIYTTDRRFKKKGLWYMTKMMVLSVINKNNPNFFKNDWNYWV